LPGRRCLRLPRGAHRGGDRRAQRCARDGRPGISPGDTPAPLGRARVRILSRDRFKESHICPCDLASAVDVLDPRRLGRPVRSSSLQWCEMVYVNRAQGFGQFLLPNLR
jgi:hypothetical protein